MLQYHPKLSLVPSSSHRGVALLRHGDLDIDWISKYDGLVSPPAELVPDVALIAKLSKNQTQQVISGEVIEQGMLVSSFNEQATDCSDASIHLKLKNIFRLRLQNLSFQTEGAEESFLHGQPSRVVKELLKSPPV